MLGTRWQREYFGDEHVAEEETLQPTAMEQLLYDLRSYVSGSDSDVALPLQSTGCKALCSQGVLLAHICRAQEATPDWRHGADIVGLPNGKMIVVNGARVGRAWMLDAVVPSQGFA
jgi:hypothetical protein